MGQSNQRPNRHSNPSNYSKHNGHKHGGKFVFIRHKNRAVKEVLKEMP